jgi:hypothetical protein
VPNVFWPYSRRVALLLAVLIWVALGASLAITNAIAGWPNDSASGWLPLVVLALGLVPPALVLLDSFRTSQATVDLRWVKFDFSAAGVVRESAGIPDNIVAPGEPVSDSAGRHIEAALEKARRSRILVVDLREGDAWWVSRLLVLALGAARSRTTEAIAFLGTREETDTRRFLGWATPDAVLRAILENRDDYRKLYELAATIERQLEVFGETLRTTPTAAPPGLHGDTPSFAYQADPRRERILLQLLADGSPSEPGSHENPPDRLTEARLEEIAGHCLHRKDVVELDAPSGEQTRALLSGNAPFVAVVQDGRFNGLLRRTDGERFILRQLFEQGRDGAGERRTAPVA